MEFNGLPLHPLVIHVVVVFAPLAALGGIVYAVVPKWRWWLRWPFVTATVIAVIGAIIAVRSGHALENQRHLQSLPGMAVHAHRGGILRWVLIAFLVPTALGAWLLGGTSPVVSGAGGREGRTGLAAWGISALLVAGSLAVLICVFLTGDSGARVVWGQ